MAVVVYRSTDPSAPVLDGQGGSLVNLLDKCLVAGYTGKTAAGWSKPFTGTNAAVFRQGAANQFYLDVNDNGPGTATTQEARLRGYEVMTAVATGTGPFPTAAQLSAGIIVRKSASASATTRVWTLIADDRTFYLFMQTGDVAGQWWAVTFGDFYSYVTGTDNYRTLIIGRAIETNSTGTTEKLDKIFDGTGHYMARTYSGLGGSLSFAILGDTRANAAGTYGAFAVPHPVDGAIWLAPLTLVDSQPATWTRGKLRGLVQYMHTVASFADQDTVAGAGPFAGRTFLLFKTTGNSAAYCIDITGPWDAN